MQFAHLAREIAREAGWKVRSLLRCRRFYAQSDLVKLYKAQVLSYIESKTAAIHHAAPSVLECIDRVQRRFLREVGLSESEALHRFKLAPLPARRDMAMLGLLHRVCHGTAPSPLCRLILAGEPRRVAPNAATTRAAPLRHHWQIVGYVNRTSGRHPETLRR